MVDVGVALTWIAISAVSAKGLSAFARAAATNDTEAEPASLTDDGALAHDGLHPVDARPRLLRDRS
jgi:hypothetical protein